MKKAFEKNLEIEKIKVASAEIVVHGTSKKPYYEIRYYDISDGKYHIGYSSYDLSIVFGWLKECFEIVQEVAEEYTSTEHINCSTNTSTDTSTNSWISCSERLPKNNKEVLCYAKSTARGGDVMFVGSQDNGCWFLPTAANTLSYPNQYIVKAWQPLPQPYKESE